MTLMPCRECGNVVWRNARRRKRPMSDPRGNLRFLVLLIPALAGCDSDEQPQPLDFPPEDSEQE